MSASGAFRLLRSSLRGEAGAWNHHRAVAAEEQKSDNRGLELCDPEKVA